MNAIPEIPGFLDRRPLIWSYSMLKMFRDNCPHQGQAQYIDKTLPYIETPERKFGNEGHDALDKRVGAGKPLPEAYRFCEPYAAAFDGKPVTTEGWCQIATDGKACVRNAPNKFGHGKVDLSLIQGDVGYINDWKFVSDKALKYEDPFELKVFALLLKAKYPHLQTIKGTYTYLKQGKISDVFDLSDVGATWNEICSLVQTIMNWRAIGEFPKRTSPLCAWCARYECENNTSPDKPS